jgi:hypothetical protein
MESIDITLRGWFFWKIFSQIERRRTQCSKVKISGFVLKTQEFLIQIGHLYLIQEELNRDQKCSRAYQVWSSLLVFLRSSQERISSFSEVSIGVSSCWVNFQRLCLLNFDNFWRLWSFRERLDLECFLNQ